MYDREAGVKIERLGDTMAIAGIAMVCLCWCFGCSGGAGEPISATKYFSKFRPRVDALRSHGREASFIAGNARVKQIVWGLKSMERGLDVGRFMASVLDGVSASELERMESCGLKVRLCRRMDYLIEYTYSDGDGRKGVLTITIARGGILAGETVGKGYALGTIYITLIEAPALVGVGI